MPGSAELSVADARDVLGRAAAAYGAGRMEEAAHLLAGAGAAARDQPSFHELSGALALLRGDAAAATDALREGEREALGGLATVHEAVGDFADTAALAQMMDLVVTVDTSVVHLAGALGRPAWVLLPAQPDWRWLLGRADSPWYPTVRLFRQAEPGDWDGVLSRVGEALDARFG